METLQRAPLREREQLDRWQQAAVIAAASEPHLIAAAPGSGKTPTALTIVADGIAAGRFARALLVAPRAILDTVWPIEANEWAHTQHIRFDEAHRMTGNDRSHLWFEGKGHIVTVTPDVLPRFVEEVAARGILPVEAIVVDESQGFRNADAVRTKALHALAALCRGNILLLSGSPRPNSAIDLWSPGRIVSRGGDFWDQSFPRWRARHFDKVTAFGWKPKPGATKRIEDEIARHAISIRLEDAVDLPPALYSTAPFDHGEDVAGLIEEFMRERTVEIGGVTINGGDDGAYLGKLHQLTNGFVYLDERGTFAKLTDARLDALEEVLEGISSPVMIPIRYKAELAMIVERFPWAIAFVGATPDEERRRIVRDWNLDKIPMLVVSPQAMRHGLNLQHGAAQTIIWFANSWSSESFTQTNARLIRSGQARRVSVIQLVANQGIDRAILGVLARKQSGEAALIAALDVMRRK